MRLHLLRTSLIALAAAAVAAGPAAAHGRDPSLRARAILPADATWAAPFPAAPNTEPAPAPDSVQPVGGFSALLRAPHGSSLAMPDNGVGSKANSHSFLLRVYAVDTARTNARILGAISLHDPNHKIPFTLVNDATKQRYLTGGDFDVESFRIDRRGTLWFGDEFGPFLLHTDLTGKVLEAPIPLPDGRTLYPTLEGPLADDADKAIRRSFTFDIAKRRYEPGYRIYHVADPTYLVSDLTALDSKRFVSLERDNFQGPAAVHKQAFVVTPRKGALETRAVLDELNIADPEGLSLRGPVRPGDFGLGDPFRMPYQTIEAVLPVDRDELAIVNDTNFGSTGRNAALPDYSDFIRVRVPAIARR